MPIEPTYYPDPPEPKSDGTTYTEADDATFLREFRSQAASMGKAAYLGGLLSGPMLFAHSTLRMVDVLAARIFGATGRLEQRIAHLEDLAVKRDPSPAAPSAAPPAAPPALSHGIVDPRDPKNHRRPLWCIIPYREFFCCTLVAVSADHKTLPAGSPVPPDGYVRVWGYDAVDSVGGFRRLGCSVSALARDVHGRVQPVFFADQSEALHALRRLTRPDPLADASKVPDDV